jgi:hypothetical protein
MARLVFLWLAPLAAGLVTLTAASATDQQWVLWGSQAGTRWGTVALFPTEAACRTKGQALVRNVATGSSREKKEIRVVNDPMPQSVGIAVIEIQKFDPPDSRRAGAATADATAASRASLERVLAIHEREVVRQNEITDARRDLYNRGVLSESEFKDGQRALINAQKNVDDTRRAIAETSQREDQMKTQAAEARAPESRLVQVRLFNAACWPVGVTPQ